MKKISLMIVAAGLLANNTFAGTNTGKTCCCVGAAKRYHTEASISKWGLKGYIKHYTGEYDQYGNPKYLWFPEYGFSKIKQHNGHICYSTVTSYVTDGPAWAKSQRGPNFHYQGSSGTSAGYTTGEDYSFIANEEFDINQYDNGFSKTEIVYNDVRFENGVLSVDSLTGYNRVSKTSIFESMTRIIVFKGKVEDLDLTNGTNYSQLDIIYETSLFITKNGISGTGFLYNDFQNSFAEINDSTVGLNFGTYNKSFPISTTEPEDNITVLVITDDGISKSKLLELHQYNPNTPNTMRTTLESAITGIKEDKSSLKLYPNPASNKIAYSIYSNNNSEATISLIDMTRKTVLKKNLGYKEGFNNGDLDITSYPSGIYLFNVSAGKYQETQKVQIAK